MKRVVMRKAVAMIELIFAIIILGITMMSAPMLISTATQSSFVAMQQEAIAVAASEIGMVLTHHWDEQGSDENITSPILQATGDPGLNEIFPTGRRAGTLNIVTERSFLTSIGTAFVASNPANFRTENDFNDIDDFDQTSSSVFIYGGENTSNSMGTAGSVGDLADINILLAKNIRYMNDSLDGGASYINGPATVQFSNPFNRATGGTTGVTSNIKHVTLTLTTNNAAAELAKTIRLNAFSCNIGAYTLDTRSFE